MKKISFTIQNEKFWMFIYPDVIDEITKKSFTSKWGFLLVDRIKDTNEFRCREIIPLQEKDFKHKVRKNNPGLYEMGLYHAHSKHCNPSMIHLNVFKKISMNDRIALFILTTNNEMNCIIYSFGEKIKEAKWQLEKKWRRYMIKYLCYQM